MEENYPLDNEVGEELYISGESEVYLKETAGWARFLAIVGFVMVGFMVLAAFFIGTFMNSIAAMTGEQLPFPTILFSILYLVIAAIYFFPILYLYRFSNKMKVALSSGEQRTLDDAFSNIKSHYKFIGILMIIVLGFYALGLIMALFGGIAGIFMM